MDVEFSIPVSLQDIETQYEYNEEELIHGGLVEECCECLTAGRSYSIDSCFSTYIHALRNLSQLPVDTQNGYLRALREGLGGLCAHLRSSDLTQLDSSEKLAHRNQIRMMAYVLVQWLELAENESVTPTNKKSKADSWSHYRESIIDVLQGLVALPIVSLWDPPSPSMLDDLAGLIASACYKVLENSGVTKEKTLLDKTISLLGMLVRDYGQSSSFSLKVPQLLQNSEHLVKPLSGAVALMATKMGVKSIVTDIVREIGSKDPKDLTVDISGTRCFATFLVELGTLVPDLILPVISVLLSHLGGESYTFRNGVLSVIGQLLLHLSTCETRAARDGSRDQLLERLMEHAHDVNAFVRVKVIQTLQQLVSSQAMPLRSLQGSVKLACGRLRDKSSSVRKAALQLLTTTVQFNPFAAKLELDMFQNKLLVEEEKLKDMIATQEEVHVEGNEDGSNETREASKQLVVVSYLQNAVNFVSCLDEHLPSVVEMLRSKTTSDALEAIHFLAKCAQFGLPSAVSGVQKILALVWSGDATVRKAVLDVHVQLYLDSQSEEDVTRARTVANNLIALVRSSTRGQLASVEKLVGMLVEGEYISPPVIKCLWDSYQSKSASNALAVQVLAMIATVQSGLIGNNFDTLVSTGLPNNQTDLVLAERTCSALSKMAVSDLPEGKMLPIGHHLFIRLHQLLVYHLSSLSTSYWPRFAESALICVFNLCLQPIVFCDELLNSLSEKFLSDKTDTIRSSVLSRLLFAVGTVAHRLMLYVETTVTRDLKRRQVLKDRPSSNDELAGASGDDPVCEFITQVLDSEVGGATGKFSAYEPIIVEILVNPKKFTNIELCNAAALALGKLMFISPRFCERHLRLFFTVLEKSPVESVRANGAVLASDLVCRFPNLIEPWTPHIYARLSDSSIAVRSATLTVLTHLILNDMVKVRGQISAIALAIKDENEKIAGLAKHFFHELASKGNTLYNVIPDIVSTLSAGECGQATFEEIVKYIFSLIRKEKQCESLVEKLCHRFRAVSEEGAARDLAHCLLQLALSERGLRKIVENFACYKDWLHDTIVFEIFNSILGKAKKSSKQEVKAQVEELEKMIQEARDKALDKSITCDKPMDEDTESPEEPAPVTDASPVVAESPPTREPLTGIDALSSARRSILSRGTPSRSTGTSFRGTPSRSTPRNVPRRQSQVEPLPLELSSNSDTD